jgi:hypothetical protein
MTRGRAALVRPAGSRWGIRDGKVWCEGCRAWMPSVRVFAEHRATCRRPHRRLVDDEARA